MAGSIDAVDASAALTADGGTDGFVTVASNAGFYAGATAYLSSALVASQEVKIIDFSGGTKIGVRFTSVTGPSYGRSNVSAYLLADSAVIKMPAQEVLSGNVAPDGPGSSSSPTLVVGTPSNGLTISLNKLTLAAATGVVSGALTAAAQTIGGAKTFSSTISASNLSGTNTGDLTLAAVGSAPSASAASLSGQVLTLQPADATHPGVMTALAQTFAGTKTFSSAIDAGGVTNATGAATLTLTGGVVDGGSAVGVTLDTLNALATTGAKLLSVKNHGTEKFSVGLSGTLTTGGNLVAGGIGTFGSASSGLINLSSNAQSTINSTNGTVRFYIQNWNGSTYVTILDAGGSGTIVRGQVADGGTAVGVTVDTNVTYANAASKLLSIQNNGTEKTYVGPDGALVFSGVASGSQAIRMPTGSRLYVGAGTTDYFNSDGGTINVPAGSLTVNQTVTANICKGIANCQSPIYFSAGATGVTLSGQVADGGSAVGVILDNQNGSLSTAGSKLVSIRNNTVEKLSIDFNGKFNHTFTDTSGTPGNGTANSVSGRSAIASGASAAVISCNHASTASIVRVQLETTGIGIGSLVVTPGTNQFTVTSVNGTGVVTVTTGIAKFSWVVVN